MNRVRRDSLVIAAAVGIVAITYGVLGVSAGLSGWQTQAMSVLVFTGASQFAVAGVIGAGGSDASAVGAALLLAARNAIYGTRLASLVKGSLPRRMLAAHFVIDESTGMATAQPDDHLAREAFWWTGLGIFVFWNLGTFLGIVVGNALGDPRDFGLDAAFPATFVALLAPQLTGPGPWVAAVSGAVIALALVPFVPAGVPLLVAALGVIPGLAAMRFVR